MRPGGLNTIDVYAVCYGPRNEANTVPDVEVIVKMNTGGKQFLPICRDCIGKGLLVKTTGNTNYSQKRKQAQKGGEKQMDDHPENGHMKKVRIRNRRRDLCQS